MPQHAAGDELAVEYGALGQAVDREGDVSDPDVDAVAIGAWSDPDTVDPSSLLDGASVFFLSRKASRSDITVRTGFPLTN